jgi:hypothetical protein
MEPKEKMKTLERIKNFFLNPPEPLQVALWGAFIAFWILVATLAGINQSVKLTFNFQLQLIEVEVGNKVAQVPANLTLEDGHLLVNGIPIRGWLEQQDFVIQWDQENQTAIAIKK